MFYLCQVTVYSALFYVAYLFALKNNTSHSWNRIYLLLCALLPLILPFIKIAALSYNVPVTSGLYKVLLPEITVFSKSIIDSNGSYKWNNLVIASYLFIVIVMLLRIIIQYTGFKRFVLRSEYKVIENAKVLINTKMGPGSFQDYIFLPDTNTDPAILKHELAHIRLNHSGDILLLRLLQAIFWPNIVLYMISRELKLVHEFQADAYAVNTKLLCTGSA